MKNKKGFTLIEILVAIAVIAVLGGIILVSMKSFRAKARGSKLSNSLSSAVAGMQSCWRFADGDVSSPNSGGDICYLGSSAQQQSSASQYGKWPDLSQVGNDYSYGRWFDSPPGNSCLEENCKLPESLLPNGEIEKKYTFGNSFFTEKAEAGAIIACFSKSSWYFAAQSTSDNIKVCCNSVMNGCKVISVETNCSLSIN